MVKTEYSTDRLWLRLIAEGDHVFARSLVNSKGWLEFIGDRHVHSEDDARSYIRKILATPDFYYWIIRVKRDQAPVGIVSFLKRSYLDYFDIGFALLPGFEGNGYAFEAAGAILADVLRGGEYSTVLATSLPGNSKSIRLLEKLGFAFDKQMQTEDIVLNLYKLSLPAR